MQDVCPAFFGMIRDLFTGGYLQIFNQHHIMYLVCLLITNCLYAERYSKNSTASIAETVESGLSITEISERPLSRILRHRTAGKFSGAM